MESTTGWIRIDSIADYNPLIERQQRYYVIICKGGAVRAAFPRMETDGKGNVTRVIWECGTGAAGLIFDSSVIACKEIDIPDDIVRKVLTNKNAAKSYFAELYGPIA